MLPFLRLLCFCSPGPSCVVSFGSCGGKKKAVKNVVEKRSLIPELLPVDRVGFTDCNRFKKACVKSALYYTNF